MRVFNIKSFAILFLLTSSHVSFASPIGSVDEAHSDKPKSKCELLLIEAVKKSANPELNYQLKSQLQSEVFVRSVQETVDKVSPAKNQLLYLSQYYENSKGLSEALARVLNKSIVAFERQGFRSMNYAEKGLAEEDGVLYRVQHEDDRFSFIILSRGKEDLERGFDMDSFAEGDLKVGHLPGKTDDLSAISIEVYMEDENGVMQGDRFTTLPHSDLILKHHKFMGMDKHQWHSWFVERILSAVDRGVQSNDTHQFGIEFMNDITEEF